MNADSYEVTQQGRTLSPGKTCHPDRSPASAREGGIMSFRILIYLFIYLSKILSAS